MREVNLNEIKTKSKKPSKPVRRRPVPEWKLRNSIKYIKLRDRYLRDIGTLTKTGKRTWTLKSK